MKRLVYFLKNYPLSAGLIVIIWVLCLIPVPDTPLAHVSMADKWTHWVMYAALTAIMWGEYGWKHQEGGPMHKPWIKQRLWLYGFVVPIVMGGLIEIAQAYGTGGRRSGDILDFAADTFGVLWGVIIGIPLATWLSRRNKD